MKREEIAKSLRVDVDDVKYEGLLDILEVANIKGVVSDEDIGDVENTEGYKYYNIEGFDVWLLMPYKKLKVRITTQQRADVELEVLENATYEEIEREALRIASTGAISFEQVDELVELV